MIKKQKMFSLLEQDIQSDSFSAKSSELEMNTAVRAGDGWEYVCQSDDKAWTEECCNNPDWSTSGVSRDATSGNKWYCMKWGDSGSGDWDTG